MIGREKNMNLEKIEEIAEKVLSERKTHLDREAGYIYYHGQRTANLVLELRERLFPNDDSQDDILYVAALFHDLGKDISPHNETGAALIKSVLDGHCSKEELEEISQLIKRHNQRDKSEFCSKWAKLLQDADKVENSGTIEVWLRFFESATEGENMKETIEDWEEDFTEDEVEDIKEELNYEISEHILMDKVNFVRSFIDRFKKEADGEICAPLDQLNTPEKIAL